jgi:hypothetical protein
MVNDGVDESTFCHQCPEVLPANRRPLKGYGSERGDKSGDGSGAMQESTRPVRVGDPY